MAGVWGLSWRGPGCAWLGLGVGCKGWLRLEPGTHLYGPILNRFLMGCTFLLSLCPVPAFEGVFSLPSRSRQPRSWPAGPLFPPFSPSISCAATLAPLVPGSLERFANIN